MRIETSKDNWPLISHGNGPAKDNEIWKYVGMHSA